MCLPCVEMVGVGVVIMGGDERGIAGEGVGVGGIQAECCLEVPGCSLRTA